MGWEGFDKLGETIQVFLVMAGLILLVLSAIAATGYMAIARNRRRIHLLYVLPLSWALIVAFAFIGGGTLSFILLESLAGSDSEILFIQSTTVFALVLFFGHVRLLRHLYGRPARSSPFPYVFSLVGIAMLSWAVHESGRHYSLAPVLILLAIPLLCLLAVAVHGHLAIARNKRKMPLLYVLPVSWVLISAFSSLVVTVNKTCWEDRWPEAWSVDDKDAFLMSCGIACLVVSLSIHIFLLVRLYRRRGQQRNEPVNSTPEGIRQPAAGPPKPLV